MLSSRRRSAAIRAGLFALLAVTLPDDAFAQQAPPPVGPYVFDVRASFPFFPTDVELATAVGQPTTALPRRGLGLTLGGHWYPVRWRAVTLGLGGEYFVSGGSRAATDEEVTAAGGDLPTIQTRLSGFAPQLSLNFGSGEGWSYISGGYGTTRLTVQQEGALQPGSETTARTFNYGGGARWFNLDHVAFTLDVRILARSPVAGDTGGAIVPRATIVVLNVGIAFR